MRTSVRAILPIVLVSLMVSGCIGIQQTVAAPAAPTVPPATEPPEPTTVPPTEEPTAAPLPTVTPEPTLPPSEEPTEVPAPTEAPPAEVEIDSPYTDPTVAAAFTTAQAVAPLVVEAVEGSGASLDAAWDAVYDLPPGVPFQLTVSQAEIDAKISMAMAASPTGGENIEDLTVVLDDGLITSNLSVSTGLRSVAGTVVVQPSIDAEGHLTLTVMSATLGPVSVPPEMLTALNVALEQALTGARESAEVEAVLTGITVDDGFMTISGFVVPC